MILFNSNAKLKKMIQSCFLIAFLFVFHLILHNPLKLRKKYTGILQFKLDFYR